MYICNENVKILNDLPRWVGGSYKGKIDNKSMVGMSLDVEYYGEIYNGIEILEYIKNRSKPKFRVRYEGNEFDIQCGSFLSGNLGKILGVRTKEFKYKIDQVIVDEKRDIVLIDVKYITNDRGYQKYNEKWYKYKCNICGWKEGWITEDSIKKGKGCSCCCNRTAVLGINTIWDTDRWMIDLGISEEDAKTHTKSSNKKISVVCPECGKLVKNKRVNDIKRNKSIGCICGDGFSYPEKLIWEVLTQSELNYKAEYSPSWICGKRYDFYLPDYNMIIETHGVQHYRYIGRGRTLQEEQENDRIKRELAIENGVKYYIELDCRKSDLEYIKNSILESKLNELFDLSAINWNEADLYAIKSNIVKEICDCWNNKEESVRSLMSKFALSKSCITQCLHKGTKLGWCNYNVKEESRKGSSKAGMMNGKKVEIFKNGKSLGIFESCSELARQSEELLGVKLLFGSISSVCRGKMKTYKGYTFKYI